jgi:CRISPR/Cas system-associated protein Csm6
MKVALILEERRIMKAMLREQQRQRRIEYYKAVRARNASER